MARVISADQLSGFASSPQGRTLHTRSQHNPFTVGVEGESLVFRPSESGVSRRLPRKRLEPILERFARSGSLMAADYQNLTFNASYALTLIELYLKEA